MWISDEGDRVTLVWCSLEHIWITTASTGSGLWPKFCNGPAKRPCCLTICSTPRGWKYWFEEFFCISFSLLYCSMLTFLVQVIVFRQSCLSLLTTGQFYHSTCAASPLLVMCPFFLYNIHVIFRCQGYIEDLFVHFISDYLVVPYHLLVNAVLPKTCVINWLI